MAQAWVCKKCGRTETDPSKAGDHERAYYGNLIWKSRDEDGNLLHYMEDVGE